MKKESSIKIHLPVKQFLCLILLCPAWLCTAYPEIKVLNNTDPVYKQLQADITRYFRNSSTQNVETELPLTIFIYQVQETDDLLSLAAGLNLPYDTLVSLNRLQTAAGLKSLQQILISNQPGIFLYTEPVSDLEEIMYACREDRISQTPIVTVIRDNQKNTCFFFPGDRFHPVERVFFLQVLFRFPIASSARISSEFGSRRNPFSGHPEQHNGIDIAAPLGTDVLAARDGRVKESGYNAVFGNYLLLAHEGNYQTRYGHLSRINVSLDQQVESGTIIGAVGNSGQSTGPHLHFEVIKDGDPRNPLDLFR